MRQQKQPLRPRIKQVLLMLARGHKEPYIAHSLGLSMSTIASYITDARQQYGLIGTHVEMAQEAMSRGWISEKEVQDES